MRTCDVSNVLNNRKKLADKPGVAIKPDMTREEREIQAILLKKRWELTNTGINKVNIKIKKNSLYINNRKHGTTINMVYTECERVSTPPPNDDSS